MLNKKLNFIFNILLIYYFGLLYLPNQSQDGILIYLMFVVPISIFIFISLLLIKKIIFSKSVVLILGFGISILLLSIFTLNIKEAISGILLASVIIIIEYFKLRPNLKLVNYLFFLSMFIGVFYYYLGLSIYGFIPGQTHTSNLEALSGRISLFPNVSASIYFAFIVFLLNAYFNKSKSKLFFMLLSFYYIYFGISRASIVLLIFIFFIFLINKKYKLHSIIYKIIPLLFVLISIMLMIDIKEIINYFISLDNKFISEYFFRGYNNIDTILEDFSRISIFSNHISIFLDNPLGVNYSYIVENSNGHFGTESFLTKILALYGLSALFFYLYIIAILHKSIKINSIYMYTFVFVFVFIGLFYGSFFAPYNVIFLIFLSSLNLPLKGKV